MDIDGNDFSLEIDLDEKKNRSMIVQRRRTSPSARTRDQYIFSDGLQEIADEIGGNTKKVTKRKLRDGQP